jgi:ABC-2 type transport system permease protein
MRVAWTEFKRHLTGFLRVKQALFFTFAVPAMFLILLGFAFDERRLEISIGVADEDQSEASRGFIEGLRTAQILRVSTGSEQELTGRLNEGGLVSVLRIRAGFGAELGEKTPQLDVFYNQRQLQSARIFFGVLNEALIQMSRHIPGHEPPIEFNRIPVQSKNTGADVRYTDFLTPGLIAMSILYVCLVPITQFITARDARILKQISLTPIKKSHFLTGHIAFQVFLCFALIGVLHALSKFLFGFSSHGSPLTVFALLIIGAAAFISMSFAIGSLAKDARSATGIVNIVIQPMIFLGGVFFSTATLPSFFQPMIQVLPVSYFVDGLRKIMLEGSGLGDLGKEIAVLSAWGVVSFLIAVKKLEWIPNADR